MAAKGGDILMKVVRNGRPIEAEGSTEFTGGTDAMTLGFRTGFFSEISDFSLNMGGRAPKKDKDKDETPKPAAQPAPAAPTDEALVDMQPVSFTRMMDVASMTLMRVFADSETLDSISIIKRKAAGTRNAGEVYMRFDFQRVLLIGMDWDDDDLTVEERWKFICRGVNVKYRPQRDDGTFGAVVNGGWTMST